MTFDELYGAGKFTALKKAVASVKGGGATVVEQDAAVPDTVLVTMTWPDGSFVGLSCTATSVYFFQCSEDQAMHEGLEATLPKAMKALGVTTFHSLAMSEPSKEMLLEEHPGFEERAPGDDHLDWTL